MSEQRQPEQPGAELRRTFDADPLTRMRMHVLAVEASDDAWEDAWVLSRHPVVSGLADRLHRAVGSIGANLAEGYSRSSARDRARLYEYALGSAREAREWYVRVHRVLVAVLRRAHVARPPRNARFDF